jgi:hypothetical protein
MHCATRTHREAYAHSGGKIPRLELAGVELHQKGGLADSAVPQQDRLKFFILYSNIHQSNNSLISDQSCPDRFQGKMLALT